MIKRIKAGLLFLFLFAFCIPAGAYDVPLPEDEAPEALFSIDLANEDVELFIKGSWDARLSASTGFGYSAERGLYQDSSHASIPLGFDFEQTPDLILSLWLFNRYYFETNFTKDFESSTYLLGYKGEPGELLQTVKIGNTDVSMENYAYWQVPDITENGLGASASFQYGKSNHEALLRFDPTETHTVIFQGENSIVEENINPGAYKKGQYFYLPSYPLEDLEILEEGPAMNGASTFTGGDGRSYHYIDESDFTANEKKGTLYFEEAPKGRLLISFSGMNEEITFDDELPWEPGSDSFTAETVEVAGNDRLVLYSPGDFPILEAARHYRTSLSLPEKESWRMKAWLTPLSDPDDRSVPLKIGFSEEGVFILESLGFLPGTVNYAWPLAETDASSVYGPGRLIDKTEQSSSILLQVYSSVSSYRLDNPLEGSLKVTINGVSTSAYTISDDGTLEFPGYIHPSDRIEVRYRTLSSSDTGGDLLFGIGNKFEPFEGLKIEAGSGLRWNILSSTFTTEQDESPGSILSSVKTEYETENFNAALEAGVSLSSNNTTGVFKALGMDDGGLVFSIPSYGVLPSSLPDGFSATKRGSLSFKDYHFYTALGYSSLQDYTWDLPEKQIYDYEADSRTGPYIVKATSDDKGGRFVVLEATLPEEESWAGAMIPLVSDGYAVDLSSSTSLNLTWKWNGDIPENTAVYIDLGTLPEDADGDGILDEELTPYSTGFIFNDTRSGDSLRFGGSKYDGEGDPLTDTDGYQDSEDINGNGYLDDGDADHTVRIILDPGNSNYPGKEWEYLRLPLSPVDQEKLTSVNGIRIFLVNEGSSEVKGTLFSGDLFFEGSSMITSFPKDSAAFNPGEGWEGQLNSDELPDKSLESSFPEISSTFHSDSSRQKIFRIAWDESKGGTEWTDAWEMLAYSNPVVLNSYSEFAFYIRIPELAAAEGNRFTFEYIDSEGNGLNASFIPENFSGWKKITIDLENKTIDGGELIINSPEVSVTPGNYTVSILKIGMNNTSSGLLFIDEIHLAESKSYLSAASEASFDYNASEISLSAGNFILFNDLKLSGRGFYQGSMFASGTESSSGGSEAGNLYALGGKGDISFNLLGAGLSTGGGITEFNGENTYSASHKIIIPSAASPLSFSDFYSESVYGTKKEFSRSNALIFTPHPLFNLTVGNSSSAYNLEGAGEAFLVQDWQATFISSFGKSFKLSADAAIQHSTDEWAVEKSGYICQWIEGYTLLIPSESASGDDRNGDAALSITLNSSPLGLEMEGLGAYSTATSNGTKVKSSSGSWSAGLSYEGKNKNDRTWRLTSDYGREFSWKNDWDSLKFTEDAINYFTDIGSMDYLYTSIPFVEIYGNAAASAFMAASDELPLLTSRNYSPWHTVSFRRTSGSYLRDLFLPSSFTFKRKRDLSYDSDGFSDILKTDFAVQTGVINLLGSRGAHPVFEKFYETEELRMIVTYSEEDVRSGEADKKREIELQNYFFFRFSSQNSLWLDNRFLFELENGIIEDTSSFSWIRSPKALPEWKVFDRMEFEEAGIEHSEGMEFTLKSDPESDSEIFTSSLLFSHETSLVFPVGSIGVFGSIGIESSNSGDFVDWQFGISTGLWANFSY